MKAKFFLLGLCALGLMACSIDEVSQVNDTNAIQFKATTATRAAAVTTNSIQEFTVWAWNDSNEFMDHVTATKQSNGTFTTSPYYFWPTGTVDFYALHPASVGYGVDNTSGDELAYIGGEISIEEDDMGGTHYAYTGNVATADISEDNIVIEAYIPGTTDEQIDLCYAITKERSSGAVPMNFRHALSQVVFKAKDINADFVVDIAEVSICSVNRYGKYTLSEVASTTDDITLASEDSHGVWSDWAHKTRFEASCTPQTLDTEGNVVDITSDPLLLIPQTVAAWEPLTDTDDSELGSYIRVLCHVTEHDSLLWPNENETSNTKTIDGVEYAYIAMPVDVDWAEGYRYTYTIIFGNGLGYYPPDDPNTDLEGTPVLVPITFNVTVDEFQDAKGVDVPTDTDLSYIKVETAAQLAGAVHSGYQTIEIAEDTEITLEGYLEFNHDCTLILGEGSTLTGPDATVEDTGDNAIQHSDNTTDYTAIIYVNGCNLTIEGSGTVQTGGSNSSDYTNAIWVVNGTVTIYGGTYKGSNWDGDTSTNYVKQAVYCGEGGYAYIYAGDFYAGKSTHPSAAAGSDGYAWVLNCHNSSWQEGHAMIYCYGGTYVNFDPANPSTDDAKSYCANGYGTVSSTDNEGNTLYTVCSITPTSYAELEALVDGGCSEITITTDIEIGDELDFTSDCVLTIAPGVTVRVPTDDGNNSGCYGYDSSIIKVWNGATVDIYAEGATFATQGGTESIDISAIWVYGGATVNIHGGTYKGGIWTDPDGKTKSGSSATVYAEVGFVNIYDGTFMGGKSGSMQQTSLLNCFDSSYKANPRTADIVCYGGTYQNFDPASNNSEDSTKQGLTNFCADGYKSVKSDEPDSDGFYWYTVVEDN